MNKAQIEGLRRDIAQHLGAAFEGEEGSLIVDDISVGLFHEEELNPDILFCYVDIGLVGEKDRLGIFETLLQLNLLTGPKTRSVFALDPQTDRALLLSHLRADGTISAKELAETIGVYCSQAAALREQLSNHTQDTRADMMAVMGCLA
jgi:hypothetical protein